MEQPNPLSQFRVSDPNEVPEVFANGPVNLQTGPEVTTIIFTSIRPDVEKLMHGQAETKVMAIVVDKLTMPTSLAVQLHMMLGQALNAVSLSQVTGANPHGGTVTPSGKGH